MRTKLLLLVIVAVMSVTFMACGESSEAPGEDGASSKQIESMIDELVEMTADKYGITKEEYIASIEAGGKTPLEEFQTAAEFMGITIEEYYEYEKSAAGNMTDEQKEIMSNMGDALKEAESTDVSGFGTTDIEHMMGLEGNSSGEIRVVKGDATKMLSYKVGEVLQDYVDEYSILFEYTTSASEDDVVGYFEELVKDTEDYIKIEQPGAKGAIFQGMINDTSVYINIEAYGNKLSVNTYLDLTTIK